MSDCLLVLNPRRIPQCLDAINVLDIDICWFSYMTEAKAADTMNYVVKRTTYDRYVVLSDDTVPTQAALDMVLGTDGPVVTGYCNLDEADYADVVNLTTNQLPPPPPSASSYHFITRQQAEAHTEPFATTFAGLAFTSVERETLKAHPFEVTELGGQMDYSLSYRLARSGIPILAHPNAYVHHVKEKWSHMDQNPEKRLLIGEKQPATTWT